jgi:hypothetical protein
VNWLSKEKSSNFLNTFEEQRFPTNTGASKTKIYIPQDQSKWLAMK